MTPSTWALTLTLAIGLLVSSTAALCLAHDEDATVPAESTAHSHEHPHAHHSQPPVEPETPRDGSDASTSDLCHHDQTPPLLTSVEGPSCDLCYNFANGSDPLLTVRHLTISPSNPIGPPLYHSPPDRPPALSA